MKAIILAMALLSTSALATVEQDKIEDCKGLVNLVGVVAESHQEGITLDQILSLGVDESLNPLIISIYTLNTRYSSDAMREEVVKDTKNMAMITCLGE
jgi:hypothetical protein